MEIKIDESALEKLGNAVASKWVDDFGQAAIDDIFDRCGGQGIGVVQAEVDRTFGMALDEGGRAAIAAQISAGNRVILEKPT